MHNNLIKKIYTVKLLCEDFNLFAFYLVSNIQ